MTGEISAEDDDRGVLPAVRALLAAEPRYTAISLGLAVLGSAVEGAGLLLLVPILGVATGAGEFAWVRRIAGQWGIVSPGRLISVLLVAFVVMMILRGLALYARDLAQQSLQLRFLDNQRLRVMRALAVAPWAKVAALDHARLISLIGIDMVRVGGTAQMVIQVCVGLISLGVQLAVVAALSPVMAAVAAGGLAAGAGAVLAFQRGAFASGRRTMKAGHSVMASAAGFLGGLKVAAAQRTRDRFVTEFGAAQALARAQAMDFQRGQARARLGFAIGSALALVAVVAVGLGWLGVERARLVVIVIVFARMTGPVQQLQQSLATIGFGLAAFAAVTEAERHFAGEPEPVGEPVTGGAIVLDAVAYRHPGGGGLTAATLDLPPGAIVGITGPSGGGKTTLIDLIAGLLVPQSGRVTVGGQPLVGGWGGAVAYVPQDGFLFHDTVRRNLDWGDATIDEAAMQAALALAGAELIVARMPRGLDTIVGERGALLSGGERQRLGIARALLRRPKLLILDEATNAIDEASEAALLDRLAALDPRPTILIVAHRDSSLRRCDRMVRVADGVAALV